VLDGPQGRVLLLITSPRVAPGLLSWTAWEQLRAAAAVLAIEPDPALLDALDQAGVGVTDVQGLDPSQCATQLIDAATATNSTQVWLSGPDGDHELTTALTEQLARRSDYGRPLPEIEVLSGSYDLPGARLLDVVTVMDTLRSPGGCPWDAQQTHVSLAPYLLEEAHEAIEAMESGDPAHMREELGDVLLQVVFHARLAEEADGESFSIDDVAGDLVAKLIHRHPHVFADLDVDDVAAVERNWESLKAVEKGDRALFEGIPVSLPALARAQKMMRRLRKAGLAGAELDGAGLAGAGLTGARLAGAELDGAASDRSEPDGEPLPQFADPVARQLWVAVAAAEAAGVDAEAALRAALTALTPPDPS
jgi:XTP/dITP diphosphohydrolase